ncbi:MAG: AraC family transcriptional regulator [Clostridia bacterium]|nr:AraC family transcriptional regulator [Clostridia bacterium]
MVGNRDIFLDRSKMDWFSLHLNHCGIQECARGYSWGFHMRPYHLIHFVLKGSGSLEINNQVMKIHAGQAFFIPAGTAGMYHASLDDPWKYCWIGFYADSRSPLIELMFGENTVVDFAISMSEVEKMLLSIMSVSDKRLCDLEAYSKEMFSGEQFTTISNLPCSLEANSRMLHLFAHLLDTQIDSNAIMIPGYNPAQEAKAFMDAAYSEHIQIQDVADSLHVHPNYLSTLFKKEYGQTPSEYLRAIRMSQAGMLLALTNHPISMIASAVGYASPFQFSTAFKSYYHISPTDYRKRETK